MELSPLLLSRIQFAFTVSFHIIFPAFTVGLAAWLTLLEALHLATGRPVYRRLFDFWLRVFAVAFGLGVVSGIVMAFEFGTNWSELSRRTGPIQGPLLAYESFTAFALEAAFFGVLIFGRKLAPRWFYMLACVMVAGGTTLSSFWILVNNSWMQWPLGYSIGADGVFVPTDWKAIIFSPVVWVRFPHMLLAAYVTSAFCIAATGAWYLLGGRHRAEARTMLRMGLGLAAVLVPVQLLFGHLVGDYTHDLQPAKFAAIEARWHDEQPASEVLIAWPDEKTEQNRYAISIPYLGSLIGSMSLSSKETGLTDFPPADRPPVLAIPFFAFRIMVGLRHADAGARVAGQLAGAERRAGAAALAALGDLRFLSAGLHRDLDRLVHRRSRPSALDRLQPAANHGIRDSQPDEPAGGDQPGGLRPGLRADLHRGNGLHLSGAEAGAGFAARRRAGRCESEAPVGPSGRCGHRPARRWLMIEFWAAALALTLLLYVVLDGFDLGVGMLFPFAPGEEARRHMLASISPVWDGNETWLVVSAAVLFGAFPLVYSLLLSAFYLPLLIMLCALILRGVAFEFRAKASGFMRLV